MNLKNKWNYCLALGISSAVILGNISEAGVTAFAKSQSEAVSADTVFADGDIKWSGLRGITLPDDYYDEVVEDDSDLALDDEVGEENPTWEDYEQELQDQQNQQEQQEEENPDSSEEDELPVEGYYFLDVEAIYEVTCSDAVNGTVAYREPVSGVSYVEIPSEVNISGVEFKVTSIAKQAFKNNKTVTNVIGSNTLAKVGAQAFSGCKKLKAVVLESKVKSIGKKAFAGCKKLESLTIKTKKLNSQNIGTGAFKGISKKAVIFVPKSKIKAYKKLFVKKGLNTKVKVKAN